MLGSDGCSKELQLADAWVLDPALIGRQQRFWMNRLEENCAFLNVLQLGAKATNHQQDRQSPACVCAAGQSPEESGGSINRSWQSITRQQWSHDNACNPVCSERSCSGRCRLLPNASCGSSLAGLHAVVGVEEQLAARYHLFGTAYIVLRSGAAAGAIVCVRNPSCRPSHVPRDTSFDELGLCITSNAHSNAARLLGKFCTMQAACVRLSCMGRARRAGFAHRAELDAGQKGAGQLAVQGVRLQGQRGAQSLGNTR